MRGNLKLMTGDKMTPPTYTGNIHSIGIEGALMFSHTGRRLTTRITDHVQERLQAAADLVGATLNQFIVQAALEKAEKIIENESQIVLTQRESLRILEMLDNPPARNSKFKDAQARYERIKFNVDSSDE